MILNLFAGGADGWAWAACSLGLADPIGIELDPSACALRAATGLRTIRADVATFPLDHLPSAFFAEGTELWQRASAFMRKHGWA